jgi:hypothetical protein
MSMYIEMQHTDDKAREEGVMTRDLDVQWVSSLSWYFLNLMGLQSVFGFILGRPGWSGLTIAAGLAIPICWAI